MKAFEFQTTLTPSRTLDLPTDLKTQLEPGSPVRVILLIQEPTEESDWARLTAEQFLKGYAESDRVYDNLGTHSRAEAVAWAWQHGLVDKG